MALVLNNPQWLICNLVNTHNRVARCNIADYQNKNKKTLNATHSEYKKVIIQNVCRQSSPMQT